MRVAIHSNESEHQVRFAAAMAAGMRRHGADVVAAAFDTPEPADVAVVWGWRQDAVKAACRESSTPLLVMERGHVPPRELWTSVGWNGLAGRAVYPKASDGGGRWSSRFFDAPVVPWRRSSPLGLVDAAVIIGQVEGDAALAGVDFAAWAHRTAAELIDLGYAPVFYRPHPLSVRAVERGNWHPVGTELSIGRPLGDDLRRAAFVATFNSTAGVESVLAGVPTSTADIGSMAWPVTSHDVAVELRVPRSAWAADLAWSMWTEKEIGRGDAWAVLAPCRPETGPA